MKSWSLAQIKQCDNCPWKVDSDLSTIPGYSRTQHQELAQTIVDDSVLDLNRPVKFMACHNSTDDIDLECIGWLHNQRKANNLGLRWMMMSCENAAEIEVLGAQHSTFEQTL